MQATEITTGDWAGWKTWPEEPFEYEQAGPFYFRVDDQGPVAAFRAERKHMNAGHVMHGGCLMTFADFALFAIAHQHIGVDSYGVTVAFTSEFLAGPNVGEMIEARGEVLRAGGSLVFVRGMVTADDKACLNFSGTIKRMRATS